jgi:hypothetical protein
VQTKLERKQAIAIRIALQTQVLKACPIHRHLYLDDDVNPAGAFALAIELVRTHKPVARDFDDDEHALTDLLSHTLGMAPMCCPVCGPVRERGSQAAESRIPAASSSVWARASRS